VVGACRRFAVLSRACRVSRRLSRHARPCGGGWGEGASAHAKAPSPFSRSCRRWALRYEIPEVTRYDIAVDGAKIPPGGLRFAVVSDLHSCRYGLGTVRAHTGHSSPKARCRLSSWATFSTT
jgi:hypothetical protein